MKPKLQGSASPSVSKADRSTGYAAVFATVAADNSLSFISVGALYVNYAETPPGSGIFLPTSNYGGTGNFNRTALYADSDGDGFFQADNNAADAAFTASFVVPEPASLAVFGLFGFAAYRRRR